MLRRSGRRYSPPGKRRFAKRSQPWTSNVNKTPAYAVTGGRPRDQVQRSMGTYDLGKEATMASFWSWLEQMAPLQASLRAASRRWQR